MARIQFSSRTSRGWNCVKSVESSITRERDLPTPLNASSTAIAFDIDLIFQRFFSSLFSLPLYHYYYYSVLNKEKFHVPRWFLVNVGRSMEKCINLFFRINLGSRSFILFRDIFVRNEECEFHLRNVWRDNSWKENRVSSPFLPPPRSHWSELYRWGWSQWLWFSDRFSRHRFAWGTFACTIDNLVYRPAMTSLLSPTLAPRLFSRS